MIGAFDPITGDLAHRLLVAMFPDATGITELSAHRMRKWAADLSALIMTSPFLSYPTERLAMDAEDYWIDQSVPEDDKAAIQDSTRQLAISLSGMSHDGDE